MIEFYDDDGVFATARVRDDRVVADPVITNMIEQWAKKHTADELESYYDDWSNGYIHAHCVADR